MNLEDLSNGELWLLIGSAWISGFAFAVMFWPLTMRLGAFISFGFSKRKS